MKGCPSTFFLLEGYVGEAGTEVPVPTTSIVEQKSVDVEPPTEDEDLSGVFIFTTECPVVTTRAPTVPVDTMRIIGVVLPTRTSVPGVYNSGAGAWKVVGTTVPDFRTFAPIFDKSPPRVTLPTWTTDTANKMVSTVVPG